MKFVIQRVTEAAVHVDGQCVGNIGKGFLVLIGVCDTDTEAVADKMIRKMNGLRIFEDENGVLTLSVRLGALYDGGDIYAGVPCVVHREGIRETIPLALTEGEKNKMRRSLRILDEAYRSIEGMLRG